MPHPDRMRRPLHARPIGRREMLKTLRLLVPAVLALPGTASHALDWPTRPIRLVVPYPAGGSADIYGRMLATGLQEALGQSVFVDNRAGATGVIGYDYLAKAAPDGYTLGLGLGALAVMPSLRKNLPFDVVRSFAPVSIMLTSQNALVVNNALPVRNLAELIALARQKPGQLSFASSGVGATPHLSMELLKTMADIDINHVPYKGDAPAAMDLIGGQVQMFCTTVAGLAEHIRQGRVRAIAVTGRQRALALPDVPTVAEQGLPGFEIISWYGLIAPAGTPREIIERLHALVVQLVATPAVRDRIIASGSDPATNTPEEFQALIRQNIEQYARIAGKAGLKAE